MEFDVFEKARRLLREFKGDSYAFGAGALARTGELASQLGQRAVVIVPSHPGSEKVISQVERSLESAGVVVVGEIEGARPNAPREDVSRLASELRELSAEVVIVIGGGGGDEAAQGAGGLAGLGGAIDGHFGRGKATPAPARPPKPPIPPGAGATAPPFGAHPAK